MNVAAKRRILWILPNIDVYMHSTQMHMCVKFEVSYTNISGDKDACKIENI